LSKTRGNFRALLTLFGMPAKDYKRFLNFLSTHDCSVDFRPFRSAETDLESQRAPRVLLTGRGSATPSQSGSSHDPRS
jgi:hypothetical protein